MKHLIVIPTYNEAENVEKIIRETFKLYPEIHILIVDDSSPDGTAEIVRRLQKEYVNLFLLMQECKSGLASAYKNGFKWALKNNYDIIGQCDADFSHNPIYISEFIKKINEGYDVVVGSRYTKGGKTTEKNFFRNLISIGGNIFADFILKTGIKDLLEGYSTYTKEALEKIDVDSVKAKGFIFQTEMKYKAFKAGLKIVEVPINFEVRTKGKSKMTINIVFEALISILRIKFSK